MSAPTNRTSPASRRRFLGLGVAAFSAAVLSACDRLSGNATVVGVLSSAQKLTRATQKLVTGRIAMAKEFTRADITAPFRSNGTRSPNSLFYQKMASEGFKDWTLEVGGLVDKPMRFTMAQLRAMPSRTQITRHDCVEGWSAIAQWKGVPLHLILAMVGPKPEAQYVLFRCADPMGEEQEGETPGADDSKYYESVDLDDAYHAQTILAYEVNDKPLPVANGAALRVRIERQLGYKHAKYLVKIELVSSFEHIRGGKGGYWEDSGYEWYAGI